MAPDSAMVLTGKQALDFSGAVSAEDNFGIGGYDRIMGPNSQGQYWAPSFPEACNLLLRHYEYCYVVPGERFPLAVTKVTPVANAQDGRNLFRVEAAVESLPRIVLTAQHHI